MPVIGIPIASSSGALQAGANAYCTVNDISDAIGGGFTVPAAWSADTNAQLTREIVRQSERIDVLTSSWFGQASVKQEMSGDGESLLLVSDYISHPIVSITQVLFRDTYADSYDWDTDGIVVNADTYMISKSRRAVIKIKGSTVRASGGSVNPKWLRGNNNYRIEAVFGLAAIPFQIELAAILLVREMITPGHAEKWAAAYKEEDFPDGYRIKRAISEGEVESLTSIPMVDRLLKPFIEDQPMLIGF